MFYEEKSDSLQSLCSRLCLSVKGAIHCCDPSQIAILFLCQDSRTGKKKPPPSHLSIFGFKLWLFSAAEFSSLFWVQKKNISWLCEDETPIFEERKSPDFSEPFHDP